MMFKAKTPHFCKIILDDNIGEEKQLGIPAKFVRRYGNYLSGKAFLKVPRGPKWQVELVRNGEHICFGKGWQQFVDFYSISYGSFLVFRFEHFEYCCFNVMIFNKSCLEIDYPFCTNHRDDEGPKLKEDLHAKTTPQIIETDSSPEQKSEDPSAIPFSRPGEKMKPQNCRKAKEEICVKRTQRLTAIEKAKAINRAKSYYKPNNPFMTIAMQPSHVGGNFNGAIPSRIAKKFFKEQRGNIILNSVDKRTWPVHYVNRKSIGLYMTCGWRKFAQANHLEVGDVCIFEKISGSATELKVVVYRGNGAAKSNPSYVCTSEPYAEM